MMLGVDGDNAYATAANWFEYAGAVASVNGQVGTVSPRQRCERDRDKRPALRWRQRPQTRPFRARWRSIRSSTTTTPKTHNHAASEITSGTLAAARLRTLRPVRWGRDFAKAASGTTDVTNDTKAVTPKAAKQIADAAPASATAAAAKGKSSPLPGTVRRRILPAHTDSHLRRSGMGLRCRRTDWVAERLRRRGVCSRPRQAPDHVYGGPRRRSRVGREPNSSCRSKRFGHQLRHSANGKLASGKQTVCR